MCEKVAFRCVHVSVSMYVFGDGENSIFLNKISRWTQQLTWQTKKDLEATKLKYVQHLTKINVVFMPFFTTFFPKKRGDGIHLIYTQY